jgi:hypothetical protein
VNAGVTGSPRQAPIFGPEAWATVAGAKWCHFDLWFVLVTVADFDGELEALERELVGYLRPSWHGHRDIEAKLSHLADLRARLIGAGLHAALLAAAAPTDQATLAKARQKVLRQALDDRAMTPAMRDTPRARLEQRARYGHWPLFPINPDRWYEQLAGRRPPTHMPKGGTFAVTRQLRERLVRHDKTCRDDSGRLALYRAFHTVGLELADRGDDSYGNIGELRLAAFTTYLGIDWAAAGMDPAHRWQDLCELLVSEVYALTYQHETLAFQQVAAGQAELVEAILLSLADEYRAAYQNYQADEALELIAWLHIASRRYTHYADAARRLGSERWMPVVALAESALGAGRHNLAVDVFRAADQPGMHHEHLRTRCLALTGVQLDEGEAPHLRIVR